MGVFDFLTNEEPTVPAESTAAPQTEGERRQKEVRSKTGFKDIGEVSRSAPSGYQSEGKQTIDSPAVKRRMTAKQETEAKEAAEKAAKAERKRKALETAGKRYCRVLANLPYSMWAKFAADPALSLNADESKELTDAYFELAMAIEPDMSNPWILGLGLVIHNAILTTGRLKAISDKEEEAKKKKKQAEEAKTIDAETPKSSFWGKGKGNGGESTDQK